MSVRAPPRWSATIVTVIGVALVSTDLRELRAGIRGVARGVPWALVSTVTFGVAGFLLGYLSQQAGWVAGLWASRTAQVICYIPLAIVVRTQLPQIRDRRGLAVRARSPRSRTSSA